MKRGRSKGGGGGAGEMREVGGGGGGGEMTKVCVLGGGGGGGAEGGDPKWDSNPQPRCLELFGRYYCMIDYSLVPHWCLLNTWPCMTMVIV